jgi:hypothetical protein
MIDSIHLRLDNPQSAVAHPPADTPTPHSQPASTVSVLQPATRIRGQSEDRLYYVKPGRNGYLYVQLSLPKWKSRGEGNVWPVTKDEARQIFLELQDRLRTEQGISTDIFAAGVARMDLFSNAATEYSYSTFKPLLDSLVIPRRTRAVYPNSVRFENKRQVDVIYDKRVKHAEDGFSVEQLPPNLIRWEYRLMVQDAVRAVTRVTTLEDLFTRWEAIQGLYVANLRAALRYDEEMAGQVALAQDIAYLVRNRAQVSRALYSKLVVEQTGSVDGIKAILRDAGATRQQIYRETMTVLEGLAYPIPSERISLTALRAELYQKLIQGLEQDTQ